MDAPLPDDIVAERERAVAFISPRWWARNPGHVLVVPRTHVENLYDIAPPDLHSVMDLVHDIARGMRASYDCSGVSIRQHNEPAGGQDVWHLHVHVFPRYPDDRLYETAPLENFASPEERATFAQRLRDAIDDPHVIDVGGERFRVDQRVEPDGRWSTDFTWINGPGRGTYGFTVGSTAPGGGADAERGMTRAQIEHEAAAFVRAFFEEGGIGPSDFPDFIVERGAPGR